MPFCLFSFFCFPFPHFCPIRILRRGFGSWARFCSFVPRFPFVFRRASGCFCFFFFARCRGRCFPSRGRGRCFLPCFALCFFCRFLQALREGRSKRDCFLRGARLAHFPYYHLRSAMARRAIPTPLSRGSLRVPRPFLATPTCLRRFCFRLRYFRWGKCFSLPKTARGAFFRVPSSCSGRAVFARPFPAARCWRFALALRSWQCGGWALGGRRFCFFLLCPCFFCFCPIRFARGYRPFCRQTARFYTVCRFGEASFAFRFAPCFLAGARERRR